MVMVGPSRSQQSQQLRCYSREPRLVVPRNRGAFAYDSSGSGDRGVSSGWSAVALRSRTFGGSETTGSARIDCSTASTLALSTVGALGITFFRAMLFGLTRLGAVLARRFFWIVLAAVTRRRLVTPTVRPAYTSRGLGTFTGQHSASRQRPTLGRSTGQRPARWRGQSRRPVLRRESCTPKAHQRAGADACSRQDAPEPPSAGRPKKPASPCAPARGLLRGMAPRSRPISATPST
jgi:hypothetical protein